MRHRIDMTKGALKSTRMLYNRFKLLEATITPLTRQLNPEVIEYRMGKSYYTMKTNRAKIHERVLELAQNKIDDINLSDESQFSKIDYVVWEIDENNIIIVTINYNGNYTKIFTVKAA